MSEEAFPKTLDTVGLTRELETTFENEGYQVQAIESETDSVVQIKKVTSTNVSPEIDNAITVKFKKQTDRTIVTIGQAQWADPLKDTTGGISILPFMESGTFGIYKQYSLPEHVIGVINEIASSKGLAATSNKESRLVGCSNCGVINSGDSPTCTACGRPLIA
jgi:hypothetical protein